ncbi:hypothetical protein TcWFU_007377 [Taenia crassiceps]|uniref:Uncharacterized protein n=1 Tax=Taenia crassiceps TaxID=6207 RepID=A0ABR4QSC9_9CEST
MLLQNVQNWVSKSPSTLSWSLCSGSWSFWLPAGHKNMSLIQTVPLNCSLLSSHFLGMNIRAGCSDESVINRARLQAECISSDSWTVHSMLFTILALRGRTSEIVKIGMVHFSIFFVDISWHFDSDSF